MMFSAVSFVLDRANLRSKVTQNVVCRDKFFEYIVLTQYIQNVVFYRREHQLYRQVDL